MKPRELLPYLVAGQALTVLLLIALILTQLSYRATLHTILDMLEARARAQDQATRPLRKVP